MYINVVTYIDTSLILVLLNLSQYKYKLYAYAVKSVYSGHAI